MHLSFRRSSALLLLLFVGISANAQSFNQVDFSSQANARLQDFPEPSLYQFTGGIFLPDALTGSLTLGGVPFFVPNSGNAQGNNAWNGFNAVGSTSRILDISTHIANPTTVYTLLNTYWGTPASDASASIEFFGSGGAYYRKDLIGGVDMRNYNSEPPATAAWTQTINGTTTTEVVTYDTLPNGVGQRLDRQEYRLPATFLGDTLVGIRLTDGGRDFDPLLFDAGDRSFQRLVLSGITVAAVPEPGSMALLIGMASVSGVILRRRNRK